MRNMNLQAISYKRKHKNYPVKTIEDYIEENILNREFNRKHLNQVWVGDISYIPCKDGTLYLSMFIDIASRSPRGYHIGTNMKSEIVTIPLKLALENNPNQDLIIHTNRGSQYRCHEFIDIINSYHIIHSMSRPGNPIDNAIMETFFKTIKSELIYPNKNKTKCEMKILIQDYLDNYYKKQRHHTSLSMTPHEYEQLHKIVS